MAGSDDEIPPPPPPPQTPTQQAPHTVSTIKLPILKKGEYDIWAMKMEHYLSHTDYPIWEVIQKGNGPVSVSTDTNGVIKVLPPKTAEEILARERERKARTTLLMALPEDHLAKFHKMTDAKDMWDAIKSRFGGNDESKKMQKYILKQQFEGFSVSNSEGLHKGLKALLVHISSAQNVAFVSLKALAVITDIFSFYKKTGRKLHFDAKELVGFDKTKVECYNCHKTGHFARECRSKGNTGYKSKARWKETWKKERNLQFGSDNEVTILFKNVVESLLKLKKLYDDKREQLGDASIGIQAFTQALKIVRSSDVEDSPVHDRFANVKGMHAVPPPMTGNY
ncbi:ribonuclease H-like domain-containing protein [Tanacetum coccineum]